MALLPKNEPTEKDITPKMFFVWGQSMSGKTFLARQFPNPVILNTDGNGKKVDTPSVEVNDFETFVEALKELEKGDHTFETIIIDLVDDIKTMLEIYVMEKYGIEALADAPYGKAFSDVKTTWKTLMVRLSQLPYNVVFVSHITEKQDENDSSRTIEVPSLEQKYYNMTMGRCDLSIKCRKLGSNYMRMAVDKRDQYHEADIKAGHVLEIMKTVKGAITEVEDAPAPKKMVKKTVKPTEAEKDQALAEDDQATGGAVAGTTVDMQAKAEKQLKKLKPLKK